MLTTTLLFAEADSSGIWQAFAQYALIGLTNGALFALVALGYTMVYGIIELINFAHGDVFMLGAFLALTLIGAMAEYAKWNWGDPTMLCLGIGLLLVVVPIFCATLNVAIDRVVYKPLRRAQVGAFGFGDRRVVRADERRVAVGRGGRSAFR